MTRSTIWQILVLPALAAGALCMNAAALADDAPPPASAPPSSEAPAGHHHHNPAWKACKKQADDQNLAPGDARRDFMKNCMKNAAASPPPAT